VVIPESGGLLEPPPPQERLMIAISPHTDKPSFMDKIFDLTPTEGNR